ncbi:MAG: hypothetical protein ACTSRZ_15680 [Promethearchaeota archaeon]
MIHINYDLIYLFPKSKKLYNEMKDELDNKIFPNLRYKVMISEPRINPPPFNKPILYRNRNYVPNFIRYSCFSNWSNQYSLIDLSFRIGHEGQERRFEDMSNELPKLIQREKFSIPRQELGLAALFGQPFMSWQKPPMINKDIILKIEDFLYENNASDEILESWDNLAAIIGQFSKSPVLIEELGTNLPTVIRVYYKKNVLIYLPLTYTLSRLNIPSDLVVYIDNLNINGYRNKSVYYLFRNIKEDFNLDDIIDKMKKFSKKFLEHYLNNNLPTVTLSWFET